MSGIFARPISASGPMRAYTGTWDSKPDASKYPANAAAPIFVTDVGPSGSFFYSNGSRWIPVNGRVLLAQLNGLMLCKAPTINANASGTANGATTLATAVPTQITKGFFYVPANSLHSSAQPNAGWYYGEMSSTTAIKFYNNTYTPGAEVYPTEPTSKTEFSGAVPGGAGVTTEVTAFTVAVPAGILGEYGTILSTCFVESNNNANSKQLAIYLNSTFLCSELISSSSSASGTHMIKNTAYNRQRGSPRLINANSSIAANTGAVDTSVTVALNFVLRTNTSPADTVILNIANAAIEASV